ncbi:TPA: hypothetical protein QDA91_003106 [Burkholderia vietnamiensis]|uniref:Uncharacterized protein n=1 Tax=Burkholderia vietnamiensis TaxID=60552 RepID=A0AA45BCB4_BURVI|nr:hypothetical protein [Burkholderia vietnamiensis]KVR89496.1 hypothetical protein WK28_24100 [Burkholderia vietnamiensis]PRH40408.1 hypothetical protein C6T65_20965 [Burkholderia vietnamiensis]HDR9131981.1 hypothetical protein [Burkholderia vietnamiensis]
MTESKTFLPVATEQPSDYKAFDLSDEQMNSLRDTSLTRLLLRTVRALSLLGEAAAGYVAASLAAGKPVDRFDVNLPVLCADRVEHVVQYALDGLSEAAQAKYLLDDIEFMFTVNRDKLYQATRSHVPDDSELHELRRALISKAP